MSRPFFFYGAEERPRSRGRHGRDWLCVPESEPAASAEDVFVPRRGYDGFFLGDEIAAFFQRLNDIGAGGFGSEALAFLERGFRLTVLDQKMDVGHGVNQAPLAES